MCIRPGNADLKGVVLGECDNLEHFADAREDLVNDIQRDGVHHVLDDHPQDGVGAAAGRLVVARARRPGLPRAGLAGERLRGLQRGLRRGGGVAVRLVSLELLVGRELHVDGALAQLGDAVGEVVDHRARRLLVLHLEKCLRDKKK